MAGAASGTASGEPRCVGAPATAHWLGAPASSVGGKLWWVLCLYQAPHQPSTPALRSVAFCCSVSAPGAAPRLRLVAAWGASRAAGWTGAVAARMPGSRLTLAASGGGLGRSETATAGAIASGRRHRTRRSSTAAALAGCRLPWAAEEAGGGLATAEGATRVSGSTAGRHGTLEGPLAAAGVSAAAPNWLGVAGAACHAAASAACCVTACSVAPGCVGRLLCVLPAARA